MHFEPTHFNAWSDVVDVGDIEIKFEYTPAKEIVFGDSNHDGVFDSSDFVTVFVAAKYETGFAATFEEGDWNGDGFFDSLDFVDAFVLGTYVRTARRPQDLSQDRITERQTDFAFAILADDAKRRDKEESRFHLLI